MELAGSKKITSEEVREAYREAAANGSAAAAAKLLVENVASFPSESIRDGVVDALQSGDPMALVELSSLMSRNDQDPSAVGKYSRSIPVSFAWMLVACDIGLDCGSTSFLVRQICIFGSICGSGTLQDVVQQRVLTPADFRNVMEVRNDLRWIISSGEYFRLFDKK